MSITTNYYPTSAYLWDAHRVWLDGHLLPQTPEKITFDHEDRTESIVLANGNSFTIGRKDGPIKISFDFKDTYACYPWTFGETHRLDWADIFWTWKQNQYAFPFEIERVNNPHNVSLNVLLTDWSYSEDANDNSDFTYTITLMEYCPAINQEVNFDIEHHLVQNRVAKGWRSGGRWHQVGA